MLSLIFKDLLLAKKMLPLITVSGFFAIFVVSKMEGVAAAFVAFPATVVMVGYSLTITAAYYEDKNKSESMVISLPIPRPYIVYAKYLSVFVYLFIGAFSYGFAGGVILLFNIPWYVHPLTVQAAVGGAVGLLLMTSFSLPLLLKFGYLKTRMITMFLFFGAFYLPGLIKEAGKNQAGWLKKLIGSIQNQSEAALMICFLGFTAVILAVSIVISLKVYEKREF